MIMSLGPHAPLSVPHAPADPSLRRARLRRHRVSTPLNRDVFSYLKFFFNSLMTAFWVTYAFAGNTSVRSHRSPPPSSRADPHLAGARLATSSRHPGDADPHHSRFTHVRPRESTLFVFPPLAADHALTFASRADRGGSR